MSRRRQRGALVRFLGGALGLLAAACPLAAQTMTTRSVELSLRSGHVWVATELVGDPAQELDAIVGGQRRRIAAGDLLAVHGVAAVPVNLPVAYLAGGEVVRGALVGGDAAGDRLELLSPVLGRIPVAVERLSAFAPAAGGRPLALFLPQGVDEALFQRAAVGYDLVAGTLHQFGEQGVRFQPVGADKPRWFGLADFVALRIADAEARSAGAPVDLLTRTGDHLGVVVRRFTGDSVQCERDGGPAFELRMADLACLSFTGRALFMSDLAPTAVVESGFDGDVVFPWQKDASAAGTPLVVAGRTHGKGLGMHSRSRLSFRVPEGMENFWTRVGLDDSAAALGIAASADVQVLVGDAVRFARKALVAGFVHDVGLLPVRAGDVVTLDVEFGVGRDIGDRVDWLSPVFLPPAGRRP